MSNEANKYSISFNASLYKLGDWTILRLPRSASEKLPSRGQVMIEGILNNVYFQTPLEPDGNFSHWFNVNTKPFNAAKAGPGDMVSVSISPTKEWLEPELPNDLRKAMSANENVRSLWQQITPMARWEWLRWIRSTNNDETRRRRIEVAVSKLKSGKRRPCCWNRNLCSIPEISKNGVLLDQIRTQ
jgi:Bacteriocin-protection, YdeI or OmpD-Associated/Domain of unknown function (DUF1905)